MKYKTISIISIISVICFSLVMASSLTFACDGPNCPPMPDPITIDVPQTPVVTINTTTVNEGIEVTSNPFQSQDFAHFAPCDITTENMFQNLKITGAAGPESSGTALASETQLMKRTLTLPNGTDSFVGVQDATIAGAVDPTSSRLNLTGQQNIDGMSQNSSYSAALPCGSSIWGANQSNGLTATGVFTGSGLDLYGKLSQEAMNTTLRTYGDPSSNNYSTQSGMSYVKTIIDHGTAPAPQD